MFLECKKLSLSWENNLSIGLHAAIHCENKYHYARMVDHEAIYSNRNVQWGLFMEGNEIHSVVLIASGGVNYGFIFVIVRYR